MKKHWVRNYKETLSMWNLWSLSLFFFLWVQFAHTCLGTRTADGTPITFRSNQTLESVKSQEDRMSVKYVAQSRRPKGAATSWFSTVTTTRWEVHSHTWLRLALILLLIRRQNSSRRFQGGLQGQIFEECVSLLACDPLTISSEYCRTGIVCVELFP